METIEIKDLISQLEKDIKTISERMQVELRVENNDQVLRSEGEIHFAEGLIIYLQDLKK